VSDIPRARELIKQAIAEINDYKAPLWELEEALKLLDRKKPEFIAPRKTRKLSPYNIEYARLLRATGMSLADIAVKVKSNIGRVSEACS
jgi:hypothetical protein